MTTTARAAIAAAASTVTGVTCTPYFRQTTKPGDAMVRLGRIDYPMPRLPGSVTWQVVLILPADVAAAEKSLEDTIPALVAALSNEMIVQSVTPTTLVVETGTVPTVFVEGSREE